MSEKLIESITHKCTDIEKRKLEAIAKSRNLSLSELIRSICMREIQDVEEFLHSLQTAFALTTDTADTFELSPQPIIDITPKRIGTKKAQLCDQLSLIAIPIN
ncbi:hypothetical protein QLH32_05625 [Acinetobacter corruptisaponis]|uniref:Ribbon-helix-helix protein, CopG family n=1 Tax=Acinetobacter corruptisaponis TaxID=3045147 RepID=A0ABY8S587_9GAMM|nr:hypothetical protein [Acinetobacter sp. KCTC 92772]WHP06868.1 hypothetical protein QLH32_05195 [Acinetobacter sp. KCTC 92772]WHP06946.1 hypothetical protein QLH32_05625 [Acinetobacter sp. KCTC 92772]